MPAGASILAALRLVTVEIRQHSLPLPVLGSKGASLPCMVYEIVVATLFMSWSRVGHIVVFLCCCVLAADASPSYSPAVYHLNSSDVSMKTKCQLGCNSPHHIARSGQGGEVPAM